jgi:hypothetical protein
VLLIDEKSQTHALNRTVPMLRMRSGIPERQTHVYRRHGTTILFAALEAATGRVTDICYPRQRLQQFPRFSSSRQSLSPGAAAPNTGQLGHPQHPTVHA